MTKVSNNNNNNDNVYGAIIMAKLLQEFIRFIRWMQTECQMAANPQTKPSDLACEPTSRLLPSTSTIATYYYYYYSAQKLTLILASDGRWKAAST